MQITITGFDPLIPLTNDFQLSQNRPNPFSSTTFFQALVPGPGNLIIYSVTGTEVARMDLPKAGSFQLEWGGLDKAGNKVPAGICQYSLTCSGKMVSNKIDLLGNEGSPKGLELVSFTKDVNTVKSAENCLTGRLDLIQCC